MGPSPRFTCHHHAATSRWSVYDHPRDRPVQSKAGGMTAARMAREDEATWRRHCERWQEAAHRDTTP